MSCRAKILNETYIPPDSLVNENITGSDRYVRLKEDFDFYSKILKRWVRIRKGFVYDQESVPLLRGTCPEAGCAHDYFCRKDSVPVVSKTVAAQIYFEIMEYVYSLDNRKKPEGFTEKVKDRLDRINDGLRKWVKWGVVYCWPGYFHRFSVAATYEEIAG